MSRWCDRLAPKLWERKPTVCVDELIKTINRLLRYNTYFSLASLTKDIISCIGMSISKQLLHVILRKRFSYSFKRTKARGVTTDEATLKRSYIRFITRFKRALQHGSIVAIDECGFDQRCVPTYAYSPVGTSPIVPYNTCSDRTRFSLVMAVSYDDGAYRARLSPSSCKSGDFRDFLTTLPFFWQRLDNRRFVRFESASPPRHAVRIFGNTYRAFTQSLVKSKISLFTRRHADLGLEDGLGPPLKVRGTLQRPTRVDSADPKIQKSRPGPTFSECPFRPAFFVSFWQRLDNRRFVRFESASPPRHVVRILETPIGRSPSLL